MQRLISILIIGLISFLLYFVIDVTFGYIHLDRFRWGMINIPRQPYDYSRLQAPAYVQEPYFSEAFLKAG